MQLHTFLYQSSYVQPTFPPHRSFIHDMTGGRSSNKLLEKKDSGGKWGTVVKREGTTLQMYLNAQL